MRSKGYNLADDKMFLVFSFCYQFMTKIFVCCCIRSPFLCDCKTRSANWMSADRICIFVIYEWYPQFPCCLNLLFGPLSLCYIFIWDCRTFITFGSMIDKIFHKCSSIFSSIIPVLPSAMCWKERCKFLAFMNYRCKKIVLLSFIFF